MGCVQSDEATLSWVIESRQLLPVPWVQRPRWWGLWLTELSGSHARPLCSKAFPNDSTSSQWLQITGSTNRNLSIADGWMHHHPFPAQRDLTVSPQVRLQWKPTLSALGLSCHRIRVMLHRGGHSFILHSERYTPGRALLCIRQTDPLLISDSKRC